MKHCRKCNVFKDEDDYYSGRNICKVCVVTRTKKNYRDTIDKQRTYHYWKRVKSYGVTQDEVEKAWISQGGLCKICSTPIEQPPAPKTHVDHCHFRMIFRGLLCGNCNQALGNFKDDKEKVLAAYKYLNDFESTSN